MNINFAVINEKPFDDINENNNIVSYFQIINNTLDINIQDVDRFTVLFNDEQKKNVIYLMDNKGMKVTAFKISINNNKFDVINSTNITSNLFVYGTNFEDKHFTIDDKISKIELFYEDISKVLGHDAYSYVYKEKDDNGEFSFSGHKPIKNIIDKITVEDNEINIVLQSSFNRVIDYTGFEKITISDNSSITLEFKNAISFPKMINVINSIDSTFYMMTLRKKRFNKCYFLNEKNQKFYYISDKRYIYNSSQKTNGTILFAKDKSIANFKNIIEKLLILNDGANNGIFPIIHFDRNNNSAEINFLEYYRMLEFIMCDKNKKREKGKDNSWLNIVCEKYKDIINSKVEICNNSTFFADKLRSLRNHYSHEGYYIPNNELIVKHGKKDVTIEKVNSTWIFNVSRLMKALSYIEFYKMCDIDIKVNEIWYRI